MKQLQFAAKALRAVTQGRDVRNGLAYALGRFYTVRRAYSLARGVRNRPRPQARGSAADTLFPTLNVERAVQAMDESAVYLGLRLPQQVVDELQAMAREGRLRNWGKNTLIHLGDVKQGALPSGEAAILAELEDAEERPLIQRIAEDKALVGLVSGYLGYTPTGRKLRLFWSFASDQADEVRRKAGQTIDYHFDVHSYNFVYVNFYLTPTDAESGAHVMMTGSHRDKPLSWLWESARQSDEKVLQHYGRGRELVIEGPPGYGFVQDASCYHKALAPVKHDRLMLQIRYF